ncbi:hypothetical protein EDF83_0571 [Pseudomonas protegens]|uniref:PIN-like domain-containing protein n=1 Tax=Pseudomonas TaxID=286 RepID=UPI000F9F825C|nr:MULTISPECIES: PIN-like domain-containing protein [Pseudomonas]MCS4261120.1 hypothetical protein [Pseudomonas sp. BIGb0176]ROQ61315.1 hypothetical protein EDF83_0571 [Pseudomonas protegens]ROQ83633.1 hypothetical protein EC837_0488 [Pseudomonas protegens]
MKSAFPGQFSSNSKSIKSLWDEAIIALDANVLLDLYRYSDSTRSAFLNVLELMRERVWISYQVAGEYFSNRLSVISAQAKHYDDAIKSLEKLRAGFENQKQHPFVAGETLSDFIDSFNKLVSELKESQAAHARRINEDEIKEILGDLFDGRVGPSYDDASLEGMITDGAERYKNKIPPGFKDDSKPIGERLKERCVPYGDYIGWMQLMDYSKLVGRGVIFVTGDVKEDWWLRHSGKTIGPLPELIEEFMFKTSQQFHMYQPDRFLEYANNFLQQEASPDAVEEIRDVTVADFSDDKFQKFVELENAFHRAGFWDDEILKDGRTVFLNHHYHVGSDGRIENGHQLESKDLERFFSERDLELEELYFKEQIRCLRNKRASLRKEQEIYLSALSDLNRSASSLDFEDKAPSLNEQLHSVTGQIKKLNEDMREFQSALNALRHEKYDKE